MTLLIPHILGSQGGGGGSGSWQPATYTDALAPLNTVYFSSDTEELSYKDASGNVVSIYPRDSWIFTQLGAV